MRILITGSAGRLGEGLMSELSADGHDVVGLDVQPSPLTTVHGSVTDRVAVRRALQGVDAVVHTATLHKPHVGVHPRQDFVQTNVVGTLILLEEAVAAGVGRFVFTSTTSAFGRSLAASPAAPATWVTERLRPSPRNVYGSTKVAAEDLCELVHRDHGLPCVVLRTARFFPEPDDSPAVRDGYSTANAQANEMLYRRVDIADVVDVHRRALERAPTLGFDRFVISATTPFRRADLPGLRRDAPAVVRRLFPDVEEVYARRGWRMFPAIDRVYVNRRARALLGWRPVYDFGHVLQRSPPAGSLAVSWP